MSSKPGPVDVDANIPVLVIPALVNPTLHTHGHVDVLVLSISNTALDGICNPQEVHTVSLVTPHDTVLYIPAAHTAHAVDGHASVAPPLPV